LAFYLADDVKTPTILKNCIKILINKYIYRIEFILFVVMMAMAMMTKKQSLAK